MRNTLNIMFVLSQQARVEDIWVENEEEHA